MNEMSPEVRALLRDAATWRLLALVFERPAGDWSSHVRLVASDESNEPELARVAERCAEDGDEATYLAMLGPGGLASPREIAYRRMGDPGRILAEVQTLYDLFGFLPRSEDPPDHVSVETDFVGYLLLRRAYAVHLGDAELAASLREAEELFIAEHLVYIAAGLENRLEESYLRAPVELLARRLGPFSAEVLESATRPAPVESDVPTCGMV